MQRRLASLALLVGRTAATQTFTPECTLPPPGTNYVSGPNTRSTLSILWNCISIIVLCTWTIQHLNVPELRPDSRHFGQRLWWRMVDATTKLKWMILTILIPEYLVGRALGDWLVARSMRRYFGWGTVESHMANMGYFVLDVGDIPEENAEDERVQAFRRSYLQDKVMSRSFLINHSRLKGRYWALNAPQFSQAIRWGMTDGPCIPVSQLEKLDKGGALVKALALVQVGYLIAQLIARTVAGLPSSQLEIATLAFAVSSGVTYLLYWSRPQGVETVHVVKARPRNIANSEPVAAKDRGLLHGLFSGGEYRFQWALSRETSSEWTDPQKPLEFFRHHLAEQGPSYLWFWLRSNEASKPGTGPTPIPNDASHRSPLYIVTGTLSDFLYGNDETGVLALGSVIGGIIFGGLHCLAWNFEFPTPAELTMWRVCSVLTTCLPLAAVAPMAIWVRINPAQASSSHLGNDAKRAGQRAVLGPVILVGLILPYILARLILMVEVFRTLCYLPPEAYIETWSGAWPHWA